MVKLVAVDLDGTLLRTDGSLPESNLRELKRVLHLGVHVVVATGRIPLGFRHVTQALDHSVYLVCANGALIIDPAGKRIRDVLLDDDISCAVVKLIKENGLYHHVYTSDDRIVCGNPRAFSRFGPPKGAIIAHDIYSLVEKGMALRKITVRSESCEELSEVRNFVRSNFPVRASSWYTGPFSVETVPGGCSKRDGVLRVAEELGVHAQDIMAVGDSENDLELLETVGYPVAMGNADPYVKRASCYVTTSNDEDGVAKALRRFIP